MKRILILVVCIVSVFCICGCNNQYVGEYEVCEVDGRIVKGKEAMDSYYERTKNGEKLRINYYVEYSYDGVKNAYNYYIKYDGKYFYTNYKMYTDSPNESKYKYLIYSEEQGNEESNIEKKEYYCLANQESYTYQVVTYSWLSAVWENCISDAMPFYCYYYLKDGVKQETYLANESLDGLSAFASISFNNSNEYSLFYRISSSTLNFGKYKIDNGYLKLIPSLNNADNSEELIFEIQGNNLIFDLDKSNIENCPFQDGTNFKYEEVKRKLTVVDNHNILIGSLKEEYMPGDIVTVKLQFFSGLCAGIKVNDDLIEKSSDTKVWQYEIYQFIMPNKDTTLYTTINGYTDSK